MARRKQPTISDEVLDQLLAGADPETAFDRDGLLDGLKKALAERALNAELEHHLDAGEGAGNSRNGYGRKTVLTDTGKMEIEVPRDRRSTFDPQLIAKYQRRFPGLDDKVISMYGRGMSVREIQGHLRSDPQERPEKAGRAGGVRTGPDHPLPRLQCRRNAKQRLLARQRRSTAR